MPSTGRDEPSARDATQDHLVGDLHELGDLERGDTRAVGGGADVVVVLEQEHLETRFCDERGRQQPRGATPDDRDIDHAASIRRLMQWLLILTQNFWPRCSHFPRNVIQKDNMISRTSSQNVCFPI